MFLSTAASVWTNSKLIIMFVLFVVYSVSVCGLCAFGGHRSASGHFVFWGRISYLPWNWPIRLGCLASKPQGVLPLLPSAVLICTQPPSPAFSWVLELEFRSREEIRKPAGADILTLRFLATVLWAALLHTSLLMMLGRSLLVCEPK